MTNSEEQRAFGDYVLKIWTGRKGSTLALYRSGQPVKLGQTPLRILKFLTEHPQEELPRLKIEEAAWPDVAEHESNLDTQLGHIRAAFRDMGDDPYEYIGTIPTVGYRLLKPVRPLSPQPPSPALSAFPPGDRLAGFRRKLHHYHLTEDERGNPVWIYAVLDFTGCKGSKLTCSAPLLPRRDADPKRFMFRFEAEPLGDHLMVTTNHEIDEDSDVAVELFPFSAGGRASLYCGARVNDTFRNSRRVASSIVILSDSKLTDSKLPGLDRIDEGLVDPAFSGFLSTTWKDNSASIIRLPADALRQRWDKGEFIKFLRKTPSGATLRIVTSFFINADDIRSEFLDLMDQDVSIEVRMMHHSNHALVLSRFGARGDQHRYPEVLEEIEQQWKWLPFLTPRKAGATGTIRVSDSDLMPYGFGAFGDHGGVIGLFPAHDSYVQGPLIRVAPGTPIYEMMQRDWEARSRPTVLKLAALDQSGQPTSLSAAPSLRAFWRRYLEDGNSRQRILYYGEPLFWKNKEHTEYGRVIGMDEKDSFAISKGKFASRAYLNATPLPCAGGDPRNPARTSRAQGDTPRTPRKRCCASRRDDVPAPLGGASSAAREGFALPVPLTIRRAPHRRRLRHAHS